MKKILEARKEREKLPKFSKKYDWGPEDLIAGKDKKGSSDSFEARGSDTSHTSGLKKSRYPPREPWRTQTEDLGDMPRVPKASDDRDTSRVIDVDLDRIRNGGD